MLSKPSSPQSKKHLLALIVGLSITVAFLTAASPFTINEAQASPIVVEDAFISRPKGYTNTGFLPAELVAPSNSFDADNNTSTDINYVRAASASSYDVGSSTGLASKAFQRQDIISAPLPYIVKVDIVMTWEAASNNRGATYAIQYSVAGGAFNTLITGGSADKAKSTDILASLTKTPAGTPWTWTDINKLVVRITNPVGGKNGDAWLYDYEVWLNVVVKSSPRIFVDIPGGVSGNLTDATKTVGTTFTVNIKVENISSLFGSEFRLRFDPKFLNADPQWAYGNLIPEPFLFQNLTDNDKGLVWVAATAAIGGNAVFGTGTFVTITFTVKGVGLTTLNLYATVLSSPVPAEIPHDESDGYFRNIAMPYSATMKALAPTESVSAPFKVDINITKSPGQSGAFGVYSWEFNMTYDKTKFEAILVEEGGYLKQHGTTIFQKTINHEKGWVWANGSLNGDLPGAFGNGTIATINFNVLSPAVPSVLFIPGKERLTKYDYGIGIPGVGDPTPDPKIPNPLPGTNPFSGLPVTAIPGAVPEFPFGAAIELALIPVIIFVWFKARRRKTPKQQ